MNPNSGNSLTFSDLEWMVSQWAYDTDEYVKTYWNQSEEMNKLLTQTSECNEKLYPISKCMVLAEDFQAVTETIICHNYEALIQLEEFVSALEKDIFCCCPNILVDNYRKEVYKNVESINGILTNLSQTLEVLELKTNPIDILLNGDLNDLVCFLNNQLKQLESIEMKIREMENKLNESNYHLVRLKFLFKKK